MNGQYMAVGTEIRKYNQKIGRRGEYNRKRKLTLERATRISNIKRWENKIRINK
jgi:hypothetical protein